MKKQIVVKGKPKIEIETSTVLKKRGRPPKIVQGVKNDPNVYSVTDFSKSSKLIIDNVIKLKLYASDISRLEEKLSESIYGKDVIKEPFAYNDTITSEEKKSSGPFETLIKKSSTVINIPDNHTQAERKNLIINAGTKRQVYPLLSVYAHGWPTYSPYACWCCCHTFETTPVGIPHIFSNNTFQCYGNFCSYNCAKRYLCPDDEDDESLLQTNADHFIDDDLSDKIQLLELLCHIETGLDFIKSIKKASKRLVLKMFGGTQTIEEYRSNFLCHTNYHVFRSPMVPISYQMEECIDKNEGRIKPRGISLNLQKVAKAYNTLMTEKHNNNTILQKLLLNKLNE